MTKKKTVKKKKLEVVFDPLKRKEFLTGFTKRKNERRKRARDEMEKSVKEERKRIRQEVKEGMKSLKKTFEPLRELTEEDKADDGDGGFRRKENEYEDDDVKVKIVELTTAQLAKQRNFLGENKDDSTDEENNKSDDDNDNDDDGKDTIHNVNVIPGMDFDVDGVKKQKNKKTVRESAKNNGDGEIEDDKDRKKPKVKQLRGLQNLEVKSKKDIDRFTKKKMRNKLQQSKAFKLKERFQQRANKKQAKRDRYNTMKSLPKTQRKKMKAEASRHRKGRMAERK